MLDLQAVRSAAADRQAVRDLHARQRGRGAGRGIFPRSDPSRGRDLFDLRGGPGGHRVGMVVDPLAAVAPFHRWLLGFRPRCGWFDAERGHLDDSEYCHCPVTSCDLASVAAGHQPYATDFRRPK